MGIIAGLTTFDPGQPCAAGAVKARLIFIYMLGGSVALLANLILGPFGLGLTLVQFHYVLGFLSAGIVLCIVTDICLILRAFGPVEEYLKALAGGTASTEAGRRAFTRAVDLPVLSVLRVEFIHIPIGITSVFAPLIVCHAAGILRFSAVQYVSMLMLGLMNGTIHSIVEYFLVSKLSRSLLRHLYEHAPGAVMEKAGGALFINARVKFYFIYFLIAVLPLLLLGATLLFKAGNLLVQRGAAPAEAARELLPWTALFIVISSAASFLMSFILSREVIRPVSELSEAMKRVEKGSFDETLRITTADEFAELFRGFNSMTEGLREREAIKQKFGRYVSESVLHDILGRDLVLGGEEKTVTILFSDIRDYTGLAENKPATEIVHLLNAYFSEMVKAIENHGGILDKFIGDAIMAVFGAPIEDPLHADNALAAAVEMRQRLAAFNETAAAAGWRRLETGIGICTGKALVGNIGSESRMEYTVIGDPVNLASRLEALTKETGRRILFADSTRELITRPFPIVDVGVFNIRGRTAPCTVFAVDG